MKWIPDDIAGGVIWTFALAICFIMVATVLYNFFIDKSSPRGLALFEDVVKIMLGAIIGYVGSKIKK